jgi:hypothetical protein
MLYPLDIESALDTETEALDRGAIHDNERTRDFVQLGIVKTDID